MKPSALPKAAPSSAAERVAEIRQTLGNLATRLVPATELPERAEPEMMSSGIAELDALAGGLPRGAITEIFGAASSGRTTALHASLAALTRTGHVCALVDATDSFDPASGAAADIAFSQLLWVRCNGRLPRRGEDKVMRYVANDFGGHDAVEVRREQLSPARAAQRRAFEQLEQALRITDLLLQAGGFSLVALDLASLPSEAVRRVPLTTWFRFRRAVENTSTALIVLEREAFATGCASLALRFERTSALRGNAVERDGEHPSHAALLRGMNVRVEMVRETQSATVPKKKARSVNFSAEQSTWFGGHLART